jgi:chromosome segregation ATPase
MSSDQLASERDALRKAVELAEQQIAQAISARKHVETRVVALEARIRAHKTKLESMHHRLEKQSTRHGHHMQRAHRISVLESQYEQCMVENRTLRTRLMEVASRRSSAGGHPPRRG